MQRDATVARMARALGSDRRGDLLLAVVLTGAVGASLAVDAVRGDQPLVLLFALAVPVVLALRRTHSALALGVAVCTPLALPDVPTTVLPALVVLYGQGSRKAWPAAPLVAFTVVAAGSLVVLCWGDGWTDQRVLEDVSGLVAQGWAAFAVGLVVGARRKAVAERDARLTRERELLTDRALSAERLRIARELHDVIGHNVSLMVVQAQALGATAHDGAVLSSAEAIAGLGRQTMREMHRTVQLLRGDEAAAPLAPQPSLANLDGLLEQSRAAGLDVELVIEGEPRPLDQGVDLSAFRIIQEALTNALKHAAGAAATITLSYRAGRLGVRVVNDSGPAGEAPPAGAGLGLTGMRERAALFGGTLTAGSRPDRGFEVNAVLPCSTPTR